MAEGGEGGEGPGSDKYPFGVRFIHLTRYFNNFCNKIGIYWCAKNIYDLIKPHFYDYLMVFYIFNSSGLIIRMRN